MFYNRLNWKIRQTYLFTGILALTIYGCLGYKTPVLDSIKDIKRLDKKTDWIRCRGLSDSDIPELARITGAYHLGFSGGMAAKPLKITNSGFKVLSEVNFSNVQVVSVGYNNHITDVGIEHITKMKIRELYLVACQSVTDEGIRSLGEMINLQVLNISGNPNITDQSLAYLSNSKSLTILWLGKANENPTDKKIIEEINHIDLSKENQISVEGLKQLSKCKSLKRIIIISERPELISEQAKKDILTHFKETGIEIKLENYSNLWKEKGGAIF